MPTYNAHIHRDGETWSVGNFATLEAAAIALRNEGATGTLTRTGTKEHAFIPSGERIFVISEFEKAPAPKDFSDTPSHVYREPGAYKITDGET